MARIVELRAQRTEKMRESRNFLDQNPGSWNDKPDLTKKYEGMLAELDDIDARIAREEALLNRAADQQFDNTARELAQRVIEQASDSAKASAALKGIFNKWLRQGERSITDEDWTTVRNTMSTTTPSEGGYTVPAEIASSLIDQMKDFGAMRDVAEVFRTATGRDLSYPTSDGTSEVGELIAQNQTATGADPTFGTVGIPVYKYSSKIVAAPIELLQDTTVDMEAFVRRRLAQRIGRITNQHHTTGTGTGQPFGIVPRASSGKVGTTGQTVTIIYDDLVDLELAVDPAYRKAGSCRWMLADTMLKVLRKIKDTSGRPIWLPSYDASITTRMGDTLLGYGVTVNNDMATPAANAKTLLFGDMSYYKIRDAMEVSMFRFTDSAYTKLGQVGFLAWARCGGNLVDTSAVKFYQHSAT